MPNIRWLDVEQVQQRIVEQQAAEQENRDQPLSVDAGPLHDGANAAARRGIAAARPGIRRSVPSTAARSRDFPASKRPE